MNEDKKRLIMTICMVIAIVILGIFVYVESSNQAKLIQLLDECDYDRICQSCGYERLYGLPTITNKTVQPSLTEIAESTSVS